MIDQEIIERVIAMFPAWKQNLSIVGQYDGLLGSLEININGQTYIQSFSFDSKQSQDVILFIQHLASIVNTVIIGAQQLNRQDFIELVTQPEA